MTARVNRPWTQEDIVYLRSHYGVRSTRAIARKLRRSVVAVRVAVSHMGIAAQLRSDVDDRTVMTWSSMLGVSDRTINTWVRHGVLSLDEEFDEPYLRTRVISEDTMEMWLRQGNAIRCRPHADTPPYWARLIAEVKAQYISAKELQRIDATLYPWILLRDCRGMGMVKLEPIRTSDGITHDNYYLRIRDIRRHLHHRPHRPTPRQRPVHQSGHHGVGLGLCGHMATTPALQALS